MRYVAEVEGAQGPVLDADQEAHAERPTLNKKIHQLKPMKKCCLSLDENGAESPLQSTDVDHKTSYAILQVYGKNQFLRKSAQLFIRF